MTHTSSRRKKKKVIVDKFSKFIDTLMRRHRKNKCLTEIERNVIVAIELNLIPGADDCEELCLRVRVAPESLHWIRWAATICLNRDQQAKYRRAT